MNKRKRILITLLLLGFLALLRYEFLSSNEPAYQGKTVTKWLDDFAAPRTGTTPQEEARAALAAIGPKAAPYIVRKLKQTDSPLRRKYREIFPKFPPWLAKSLPRPENVLTGTAGGSAFLSIGPSVEPKLSALLNNDNVAVREAASFALGSLRHYEKTDIRDAIPALIQGLRDQDGEVRVSCANALGFIGQDAYPAVAALASCLNDPETGRVPGTRYYVRSAAARALGKIGPKSKGALPALKTLQQDLNIYLRIVTAVAIWRIDSDVTNTLPALIDGLNKVSPNSTWEVVEGMEEMGPRAKAAVPALIEYLKPKPPNQRGDPTRNFNCEKITNALMKIDPAAAARALP